MSPISFDGQAVIVTGAGAGLGRGYALELARRGASVLVNDPGRAVDGTGGAQSVAQEVVDEITAAGGTAAPSFTAVGTREAGEQIVAEALEAFGRLDAVISNAGILRNRWFADTSVDDWDATINTHLAGTYWVAQAAYRHFVDAGGGRLVFISSNSGIFGTVEQSAYASAKAAILGLVNCVAAEGAEHGVIVNAVLPIALTRMAGVRETPTEDLAAALGAVAPRMVVEQVVPLAVYLASDACTTSGSLYSACGGRYARLVVGVGDGWLNRDDEPATADDLAAHWDEIGSTTGLVEPQSGHQEIVLVADRLAAL